jgi:hypothetical protein
MNMYAFVSSLTLSFRRITHNALPEEWEFIVRLRLNTITDISLSLSLPSSRLCFSTELLRCVQPTTSTVNRFVYSVRLSASAAIRREKKIISLFLVRPYLCVRMCAYVTSSWCSTHTCTYTRAFKGQRGTCMYIHICVLVREWARETKGVSKHSTRSSKTHKKKKLERRRRRRRIRRRKMIIWNGEVHDYPPVIDINMADNE